MNTVKYIADIETPTEYTGYLVDGTINVPMADCNRHYKEVQEWVAGGNTIEPAYTQDELDEYATNKTIELNRNMLRAGNELTQANIVALDVGVEPQIKDKPAHDSWVQTVYADEMSTPKPPPSNRQKLPIEGENRDRYTFTRYKDQWGYRWYLRLHRESVNALALAIYDKDGNYLYTTGALIAHSDGGWYTECPAGQADAVPEDVYFKWLLGSAPISDLEVYNGADDTREGFVRSDERYDK